MTQIAISPTAGSVRKTVATIGIYNVDKKSRQFQKRETYLAKRWTDEFINYFWIRNFIVLPLLALPVSLIAISTATLFGYLWIMIPIISMVAARNITSSNSLDIMAQEIFVQLKGAWRDHGDVFRRQIWDHDCAGEEHGHSYYSCEDRSRKCKVFFTTCTYCDKRLLELNELLLSQQKVDVKTIEPINESLFEASEQFRKAVEEQLEPAKLDKTMAEISAKANKK